MEFAFADVYREAYFLEAFDNVADMCHMFLVRIAKDKDIVKVSRSVVVEYFTKSIIYK